MFTKLFNSLALTLAVAAAAGAQTGKQTGVGGGGSPHWRAEWTVDGAKIIIGYGRPYLKGRPEADLMPAGAPWRTGADTATTLIIDKPVTFGGVTLQPGSYTINTQPGTPWQLILGKLTSPGQWGVPYRGDLEIGRAPMVVGRAPANPVEQVTIEVQDTPAGGALSIAWGTTRASIPFTVGK